MVEGNAQLQLWTTDRFLKGTFLLTTVRSFGGKSRLMRVKNDTGMGNDRRVSHELFLLGVRGSLTFRDFPPVWVRL